MLAWELIGSIPEPIQVTDKKISPEKQNNTTKKHALLAFSLMAKSDHKHVWWVPQLNQRGAGQMTNVKGGRASPLCSGNTTDHFIFLRKQSFRVLFPCLFTPSFDICDGCCHCCKMDTIYPLDNRMVIDSLERREMYACLCNNQRR